MSPWVQIACALLWNWVASGPIFGFSALKPVLFSQGVYREVCEVGEMSCVAQDLKLNSMFTVAASLNSVIALPVGYTLDHKGPRVCGYLGSLLLLMGTLLMANASRISIIDGYLFGYALLGIGGCYVFISSFHLMNSVDRHSGKVLAAFSGVFDSSSALFMFYRLYYEHVHVVGLHTFFSGYIVVPVFIFLCEFFIMPAQSYEKARLTEDDDDLEVPEDIGNLHGQTVRQQLASSWFVCLMIFAMFCMLRLNYFMATVRSQESYLLNDPDLGNSVGSFFDVMLPVGGFFACPFIGLLLDNFTTFTALQTLCTSSVLIGVLGLFPNLWLNLLGIFLFTIYRPFFYCMVSHTSMRVFGLKTFGTVYGVLITTSGILNLLQVVVDGLTHSVFHMNPTPMNVILTGGTAVAAYALVTFAKSTIQERALLLPS